MLLYVHDKLNATSLGYWLEKTNPPNILWKKAAYRHLPIVKSSKSGSCFLNGVSSRQGSSNSAALTKKQGHLCEDGTGYGPVSSSIK